MLANMEVVRCVEEVGEEELRAFLRGVRVFGFHSAACGTVDRHLLGLSSYDGQRACVAAWLDLEEARRTLEHETSRAGGGGLASLASSRRCATPGCAPCRGGI